MLEPYHATHLAILVILATMMAQTLVATVAHRKQKRYVPGVVDENLGHDSFVFRSHRTYQNSLENTPLFMATVFLAMFMSYAPVTVAWCAWIYAVARVFHMGLYYAIATEKNPSPRSYFYAVGLFANIALMVLLIVDSII